MNTIVKVVLLLTVLALGYVTIYTFSPSTLMQTGPHVNPESIKPTFTNTTENATSLKTYHNRDVDQNFYAISVPSTWAFDSSNQQVGGYRFNFLGGTAKTQLMDVADNTTLELMVLSQEEPKLKATLPGYRQITSQKLTINGNDAYQLTYQTTIAGITYQTTQYYVSGPDHAAVITFTSLQAQADALANEFNLVIRRFIWE